MASRLRQTRGLINPPEIFIVRISIFILAQFAFICPNLTYNLDLYLPPSRAIPPHLPPLAHSMWVLLGQLGSIL
jgi:hypothetical protein